MTATIKTTDGYTFKFRKGMADKLYNGKMYLPDGKEFDGGGYTRDHVARAVKYAREAAWAVTIK